MENTENTETKEAEKSLAPAETHHPNSPSSLKRRELCPGSYNIEKMLKNVSCSETAKKGSKIHAAVAITLDNMAKGKAPSERLQDPDFMALEADEMQLHDAIITYMEGQSTYFGFSFDAFIPETRLSYRNLSGELYYGTCDLLILDKSNNIAYVYDWKTGFREVDDAANNLQGAAYALAVAQMYNIDNVHVAFFNPAIRQHTDFIFDEDALISVAEQIEEIIENCKKSDAPCIPGEEQCRYCLGAICGACPAYMAKVSAPTSLAEKKVLVPIEQMEDDTLTSLFVKCKAVEKLKNELEKELKLRINAKGSCAGYTIKQSSGGREAKDIDGIYSVVNDFYNPVDFMKFCTLSLAKLEKDVTKKMKENGEVSSEKAGKELFYAKIAPFISDKAPRKVLTPPPKKVDEM